MIEASTSTTSATSPSSASTSSSSSSASATTSNGGRGTDGDHGHNHGSIVGPVVGGVVGGVAGIAAVAGAVAWLLLRRRRKNKMIGGSDYNAVAPRDQPPSGNPQQPYLSPKMSEVGSNAPTTFPPTSPYPSTERGSPVYDPRGSYYASTEKSGHGSPGWQQSGYSGYAPSGQPSPQGGLYPPSQAAAGPSPPHSPDPHHQSITAELESPPAPAGHESNPVELRG